VWELVENIHVAMPPAGSANSRLASPAMRLVDEIAVFENGSFRRSALWKRAQDDVRAGISRVVWPPRAKQFTIRPVDKGNGVKPIKAACVSHLESQGWQGEALPDLLRGVLGRKDLDALLSVRGKHVAFEWETGNISSSHRAVNKLLVGFSESVLSGAILVVPSRQLYRYLTDRVGNVAELEAYLDMWSKAQVKNGCLKLFVVEHDAEGKRTKLIPKGTDGWHRTAALKGKS